MPSEHTLLQLVRGNGLYHLGGDPVDSMVTLVGDVTGDAGLIETAGATLEARRRIWERLGFRLDRIDHRVLITGD